MPRQTREPSPAASDSDEPVATESEDEVSVEQQPLTADEPTSPGSREDKRVKLKATELYYKAVTSKLPAEHIKNMTATLLPIMGRDSQPSEEPNNAPPPPQHAPDFLLKFTPIAAYLHELIEKPTAPHKMQARDMYIACKDFAKRKNIPFIFDTASNFGRAIHVLLGKDAVKRTVTGKVYNIHPESVRRSLATANMLPVAP